MSVINKMLQEIEERHDESAQKAMPNVVRAVPLPGAGIDLKRIGIVIALLLGVVLVGLAFWQQVVSVKKPAAPAPVAVAPAPAVVAPTPIIPPPAPAVEPVTEPVVEPGAPAEAVAEPQLQAATDLSLAVPAPAPVVKPAPKAVPEKPLLRAREETASDSSAAPVKSKPEVAAKPAVEKAAGIKQVSPAQRIDYRYREALSLISQGRQGEAQAALEEVLKLDPRHLGARQVLLALHVEARHYAVAEQLLREGLQLKLAPATHAMTLARLQLEQGNQAGALATLEQHAAQAAGNADYAGFHAALLQRANRHAEAILQFQTALKLRPSQGNWWLGLGVSLQAEKRNAEAEQAYLRAKASNLPPELQALVEQRLGQLR